MNRPSHDRPTPRVVAKYALLQLPSLLLIGLILILLHHGTGLPMRISWGIFALWVLKDLALFPLLWRSYAETPSSSNTLAGAHGVAMEILAPRGYVRIRAELWRAEVLPGCAPVQKGEEVRVLSAEGLILLVAPVDGRPASPGEGRPPRGQG